MKALACTLALALATVIPACSTMQASMQLPQQLEQAQRMEVAGRQGWKVSQQLRFGNVRVHDVQRSWTTSSTEILNPGSTHRRQSYSFSMQETEAGLWQVKATAQLRQHKIKQMKTEIHLRDQSSLIAQLTPAGQPQDSWTLELKEDGDKPFSGRLHREGDVILVKGTNRLQGSRLQLDEATGYVFEAYGRQVAAVEVINDGAVWLANGIGPQQRAALLAAISTLLLLDNLRQD